MSLIINSYRFITGAWTPAVLSPVDWWDFSDSSTVTLAGTEITQITDKGSGGRTASNGTAGSRPVIVTAAQNGRDVASFDGSNDNLQFLSGLNTTPAMTVCSVFRRASSGIKTFPVGGSGAGQPPYALQWWTDNFRYSALWGSTSGFVTHGAASTATGVFSSILVKDAANTTLFQDGTQIGVPQTTIATSGNVTHLGRRANDYHNGWLGEVVILTSALSLSDRQKMEGYLAHKWGLTLPVGHPYESAPP